MRRGSRFILGATVALLTIASLHYTVGHRFHNGDVRQFAHYGCGGTWERYSRHREQPETLYTPRQTPQPQQP